MKQFLVRWSAAGAAALALALSGCGGGGGGDDTAVVTPPPSTPTPTVSVSQALAEASVVATNDTATNSTSGFSILQGAGVPVVTVNSPPKVNFAIFSDGAVKKDITISDVSFIIAKLVPGTNGEPEQWKSYTYRKETATATAGPGGKAVLASAMQATTDAKPAAAAATQLVLNPDGYYTYNFAADIKDPAQTNGVTFEPNLTHRVAIQLSYKNAAGQDIRVNPYYDFTIDANGNSVPVAAGQTRKMTDVGTCNGCHDKLALHGGGRVDTQFCVMCHNPSTTDANSGNNLNLATMVHKIHSGRELHEKGETYAIWGYRDSKHDYSEVGYPQPTRNCASCHTGTNAATPQGDNWKSKPTKEACLTCHQSGATSAWAATHVTTLKLGASADAISNSTCLSCHSATSPFSAEKAHWMQELANTGNYQSKILSVSLKKAATATATGLLTVKYSVVNPTTGAAYDLREGCSAAAVKDAAGNDIVGCNANYRWDVTTPPGKPTDKFGMFTLNLAAENLPGVTLDDTTGGGSGSASWQAYRGVADGAGAYTADLTIPAGAKGNARVMMLGAVSERRLDPLTREPIGAVPPTVNADLAYVPVKAPIVDVNIATGGTSSAPRRQIVSNDACNSCHAVLGLPMGNQKVAFHKGHRNNSDGCAVCHNGNQAGSYTLMADGSQNTAVGTVDATLPANTGSFLHEPYQAKRFVHGIHYGAKRTYPFTHCMTVGGEYNKDGTSKTGGLNMGPSTCVGQTSTETLNFTAEVAYPGQLSNCANCHVKDSWKQDKSVIGSVVFKPGTAMLDWYVISPKAATCTSCHDSKSVQTHVKTVGASFGTYTQGQLLAGQVFESCEGCHAPGSAIGVDTVHGLK